MHLHPSRTSCIVLESQPALPVQNTSFTVTTPPPTMCCSKKRTAPLNPIFYTTASPSSPSYSTTNIYTNATIHQPRSCRRAQHTAHQHPPYPSSLIGYVARKIREGRAPKRTDDNGTVRHPPIPPPLSHPPFPKLHNHPPEPPSTDAKGFPSRRPGTRRRRRLRNTTREQIGRQSRARGRVVLFARRGRRSREGLMDLTILWGMGIARRITSWS